MSAPIGTGVAGAVVDVVVVDVDVVVEDEGVDCTESAKPGVVPAPPPDLPPHDAAKSPTPMSTSNFDFSLVDISPHLHRNNASDKNYQRRTANRRTVASTKLTNPEKLVSDMLPRCPNPRIGRTGPVSCVVRVAADLYGPFDRWRLLMGDSRKANSFAGDATESLRSSDSSSSIFTSKLTTSPLRTGKRRTVHSTMERTDTGRLSGTVLLVSLEEGG